MSKRFGVFSFNISGPGSLKDHIGKPMFHPHFIAKIMNDFFGI